MSKESELVSLNRRREINRRLAFVKQRMNATPAELAFAKGALKKLPAKFRTPPPLALAAARLSWRTGFGPLTKLTGDAREKLQRGDIWEIFGVYRAMYSYIQSGRETGSAEEQLAHRQLKRHAAKAFSRSFLRLIGKIEERFKLSIPTPALSLLVEQAQRNTEGLTSFVTPSGEMPSMKTATARVYHSLWFFWPHLEGRWTAPALHSWLRKEMDEKISDKLVERLLTSIRREAARARKTAQP